MNRKDLRKLSLVGLGVLVFILTIFPSGGAMAAPAGNGSSSSPTLEWTLEADVIVPDGEIAERGLEAAQADAVGALTAKLKAKGVKTETSLVRSGEKGIIHTLKASGSGTVDTFRNLIYKTLKPQFNILGGPTQLEIESPAYTTQDMVIVLEANPSTGYGWRVTSDSAMVQNDGARYEMHTRGRGVPQRQIIRLTPGAAGAGPVSVVYKRAREETTVTRRLKVRLSTMPSKLDLSNPEAPTAPSALPKGVTRKEVFPIVPQSALPDSLDWRDSGIVTPIRDQGSCGSCWSFGTVGIMESALAKSGTPNQDLSEQFLISCNQRGWDCDGGFTAHMYHYDELGKNQTAIGAVYDADKPYTASNGTCNVNYNKPHRLTGWQFIGTGSEFDVPTVDQIKSAIYTYGPITAGICAGEDFDAYTGGIFQTEEADKDCGGGTNHQIILVGWNNADGGYWILRNSWGTDNWGEAGYMRIKWGISRVGEGTSWVTTGDVTTTPTLTVRKSGTGTGTVTSSPGSINCGATCTQSFDEGTVVTLTASAGADSTFSGWSGGGCSGTGTCAVTMSVDVTVTAAFSFSGCDYTLRSTEKSFPYRGGSTSVYVTATGATTCPAPTVVNGYGWVATSQQPWRNNKGAVKVTVGSNPLSAQRPGTIVIGNEPFTITQAGAPCRITGLTPSSATFTSSGGDGSFGITVNPADCRWTASTVKSWLDFTPGSGTGSATISVTVDPNDTNRPRNGTISVSAGNTRKTFTVRQTK
jgi:C1A family cysteine protease